MPTQEVSMLVAKYESNRKSIRIFQTRRDRLRRDYSNAWNKIRLECEKAGHDKSLNESKAFHARHLCPYCRKQIFPTKWYCDSWEPNIIFDADYCKYWLEISEEDWPPLKQNMLKKIKSAITTYFGEIAPVEAKLSELRVEQDEILKKLDEIFKLCDSVLKISANYEDAIRKASRGKKIVVPPKD